MKNKSLWFQDIKEYPKLTKNTTTDVLIVGGGLSGLSVAYYLSQKNVKAIVVDKDYIGGGTSGHTSAHITFQHDLIYDHYIKEFGLTKAKLILEANVEAINAIKEIVNKEKIDCDLKVEDSYLISSNQKKIKKLQKEYQAYQKLNINTELINGEKQSLKFIKGLVAYNQMHFNPIKYLNGLADALIKNGGEVYQDFHVLDIQKNFASNQKFKIEFKAIVIATHNPIINIPGLYFTKMYLDRSYTAAIAGNSNFVGMFNEIDKDGLTYRNYNELLLIGGKDHKCGSKIKINYQKELQDKINAKFANIDYKNLWHAQDGITIDKLPYIGKYSKKSNNTYVITGFGKWGMTNSNIAGRIIADLFLEQENPYIDIYSPQRKKSLYAISNLVIYNFNVAISLISGITRLKSPACSHLKCKTKYNKYTKSYDCPCHGSRFTLEGEVIDSPANKKI